MTSTRPLLLLILLLALPASAGQTYFHSSGGQLNVGWQDREGEVQQLTYRLEAGKLPPLIAYRSSRMQEEVLQRLLQRGGPSSPAYSSPSPAPGWSSSSRAASQSRSTRP